MYMPGLGHGFHRRHSRYEPPPGPFTYIVMYTVLGIAGCVVLLVIGILTAPDTTMTVVTAVYDAISWLLTPVRRALASVDYSSL